MSEHITVKGTTYRVVRRVLVADMAPATSRRWYCEQTGAQGEVYLAKAHGGTRVYRATEYGDGQVGLPVDTHTNTSGYGVR